ncbi:MAG: porin [Flavobacteriaceae bacterium]|nr:porin [Flavobacteriaceae bacterium]
MKKFKLFLYISLLAIGVFAQENDSIQIDEFEDRLAAMPYYSYGKGIGITSPDSLYQMNIRFRMQNRISFNQYENESDVEAMVRRLRLRFDGFVGDPRFQYAIQLSFSPEDVGEIKDDSDLNIIRDAMFFYVPDKHWQLGFGQTKLPGNRQRINSSGALQLTDRSINNSKFNIDRDFGIQIYYLAQKKSGFDFNIKTAISTGEGRNWLRDFDNGLAYTGRLELFPMGAFSKGGAFFEGDIARETQPKLMLSTGYQFNNNALRNNGQRGERLYEARDIHSFFADAIAKYDGWALMLAYMAKNTNNHITINPENPEEKSYIYEGKGYDAQLSYLFRNNYEIIGRFSHQLPNDESFMLSPRHNQMSLGVTKYIWEHTFKIQAELSKNDYKFFDGSQEDDWYIRFQVEIGI